MGFPTRVTSDPVRELSAGSIGSSFSLIGSSLSKPARMIMVQNLTNALLMFSFDGIDGHFPLPSNGSLILDITTNKVRDDGFFMAEGESLYVREIDTPTTGSVYFSTFFGG